MEFTSEIKKKRMTGIGGSEVPAILGLSKFSSPYKVWALKTGREQPFTGNKYTTAGSILESAVVDFFARETNYRIIKASAKQRVFVHPKVSYAIGMPDRFYFGNRVGRGILECKTTQTPVDDVPEAWFAQLQWYLGIVGLMYGGIAWLEHGLEFKHKEYEFDPDFFNFMLDEVSRFWNEHILADVPPDPINVEDIMRMYPRHTEGAKLEATPEIVAVYNELVRTREVLKELESKETELTDKIKMVMRDNEMIVTAGKPLFTWKTTAPSVAFDAKMLKEKDPDVYNAYSYEKPGSRRFLIK